MALKKEEKLRCPGCAKLRGPSQLKRILSNAFFPIDFARLNASDGRWACDLCLRDGIAVAANPKKQVYGLGTPYLAFITRKYRCAVCSQDFLFSGKEQKFWFEKLQFNLNSEPIRCATCRKEFRRHRDLNTQLSQLLRNKQEMPASDWLAAAEIYGKLGNAAKKANALSQARKRLK